MTARFNDRPVAVSRPWDSGFFECSVLDLGEHVDAFIEIGRLAPPDPKLVRLLQH
ncbi:hypothetical protein ABZ729_32655 [Streptomyces sp. NPDC006678]|uniref:hypothetical protein n=1 Tax=Streptomyces sp. NPDC006678 TaxID=3157185 RepID=UPI0033C919FE